MPPEQQPSYLVQLIGVIVISLISGLISVGRRILKGSAVPTLWIIVEIGAAILVGFLAWDAYPDLADKLPHGVTRLIFTCACAHVGGRILQQVENYIETKLQSIGKDTAP